MPDQAGLDPARLHVGWTEDGWQLTYDLSYLHPDWGQLIQTYQVISQDYEGQYIYESSFALYKRGERVGSSFASYPKPLKAELWKVIFAVKRRFFEEIEPDIVTHFIKQEHSVEQRYQLYAKYLNLPEYELVRSNHDFTYFRLPAANAGRVAG